MFSRNYGLADKRRGIANGPDTIFTLGSITKMFTAVAVLQNVEQGRLALTDRLGAHLDGFPAAIADTVTIHQLLTHTSGLGDYFNEQFWQHALEWDTVDEVMDGTLAVIKSLSLKQTPGSEHLYSNAGYHCWERSSPRSPAAAITTTFASGRRTTPRPGCGRSTYRR